MVDYGVGRHVWAGPPGATKAWARGLFVSELAYTITIITVKWSTLAFYWRVFATKRSIRWPIWILGGIVSAWGIAVVSFSSASFSNFQSFGREDQGYDRNPATHDQSLITYDKPALDLGVSMYSAERFLGALRPRQPIGPEQLPLRR